MFNKRTAIIVHDLFMAGLAWQLAWWARFNFEFPFPDWWVSVFTTPFVIAMQGAVFFAYPLYRGMWRFASMPDLWNIVRAAAVGALCITLMLFILIRLQGVPRSILILYPVLLMFCLGGPRLSYRFLKDRKLSFANEAPTARVLIVGAGRAGEMLAREMLRAGQYFPVGFIDDAGDLANVEIRGVRVLGAVDELPEICRDHRPDLIVIAIPSATSEQMQRIVDKCAESGVPMRTLPGLNEMVAGGGLRELRNVSIEDLLGRARVELDWKIIQQGLSGRVVLVSGGGGSIGSELCRQIAHLAPAKLIVVDRSEYNLYRVHHDLLQFKPSLKVVALLGDVCDPGRVDRILSTHKPQAIFHAAAYKHVPILEDHVREAVLNNVFGTACMADAARRHDCEKFVLISTDKAVNPTSTLGASKRVAEMLCEARNSEVGTHFITVRFGNVLGSEGSAIPLFQEQIRKGGPVTVTHPEVTRYFMTTREACQLILQSAAMGNGGEVYVLDMGKPVRIAYLAEQMIRLSGAAPGSDIRIEFTGLRPGEKLSEELFYGYEQRERTAHAKIILARHPEVDRRQLESGLADLRAACERFEDETIIACLRKLAFLQPSGVRSDNVVPISPGNFAI